MATFEHGGVVLAYDDTEEPAPAIVFLHGLSSARTTWATVMRAFAPSHRLVALDQRGHGDSSHAPGTYTLDRYLDDTIAFCDAVVREPAVIVGHSLGGVIAFCVARERPDLVRGAFLEDPPLFRGENAGEAPPPNSIAAMFPVLKQMLADMQARSAPVDDYVAMVAGMMGAEAAQAHGRAWASVDPEVFTPAIEGGALTGIRPDTALNRPVHVLRADPEKGAAFTTEDEARFLAANPNAVVEVIPGASHIIHDEQPDRFVKDLSEFMEGLAARG